jgi:hypothetical protein
MNKALRVIIGLIAVVALNGDLLSVGVVGQEIADGRARLARSSGDLSQGLDRDSRIIEIARSLGFLEPQKATRLVPSNVTSESEVRVILETAMRFDAVGGQTTSTGQGFCSAQFAGTSIEYVSQTSSEPASEFLEYISQKSGVSFIYTAEVGSTAMNAKVYGQPWGTYLKAWLRLNGIRATCENDSFVVLESDAELQKRRNFGDIRSRFVKLKFLQPTSQGTVDVAGRGGNQGCNLESGGGGGAGGTQGCGNFEKLVIEIEKILGLRRQAGTSSSANQQRQEAQSPLYGKTVTQIPGRNILLIRATEEELAVIDQLIERADRPPFQVLIKGLVYTANESKLRDIGMKTSMAVSAFEDGTRTARGAISTGAVNTSGSLFDFSALVGTAEFSAQASLLETQGAISIQSRPFVIVLDGQRADLDVGRQIPVLIQAQSSLGGAPGQLEILQASNLMTVTPFVIDDEDGNPTGVNLTIQLESNDVDTSIVSQGVPSVNRRSVQSRMILDQEKTVILGGFTVDTDSSDVSKTPGLGDLPILGFLFKRKIKRAELNRLYFAISVSVVPYGTIVQPVDVPDASTSIPGPGRRGN